MDSLSLLKTLVEVDSSVTEAANQLIDYVSGILKSRGIHGEIYENAGYKSYVATIGKGDKTLVLNGHLDVVSGKPHQFTPYEEDGKLFGRGTADMKSGCAAMIGALIKLKEIEGDLGCQVMLQLVTDEETGGFNCSKFLAENGYTGDFVICTEPTQLQPSIQSKGMIKMDVSTKGLAAHGSRPWEGDNAIVNAFKDFMAIEKLPILEEGSAFYKSSTVNFALINGGDIYNRVPASCVMGLDIRYVPHVDPHEIIEAVKGVVSGTVHVVNMEPGVLVESTHPYIEKLKKVIKKAVPDHDLKIVGQHGGSDARFFAARGIPAIEMGPKGDCWHGDGEYVDIQSVYDLEKILIDLAQNFS